jgi:hypothetical protein
MKQLKFTGSHTAAYDENSPKTKSKYANKRTSLYPFDKADVKKKPAIWFEDLPRPMKPPGK